MPPTARPDGPGLPCLSAAGATRAARATDARLTVVTGARDGGPDLARFLEAVLSASVDAVRLRRGPTDADDLGPALAVAREACDRAGALLLVDDDVEAALDAGADGVHLTRRLREVDAVRVRLGPDLLLGRSVRSAVDLAASADEDVDHVSVPVRTTVAAARGERLHLVRIAAKRSPHPWAAAGGIGPSTVAAVLAAGARRIVVGAALTRAPDPDVVAWQLRRALGRVH